MLTTREKLCKAVNSTIRRKMTFSNYVKKTREYSSSIHDRYNIPINITTDYLSGRKSLYDASDFMLFAIMDCLEEYKVSNYFTEKEIKTYSRTRYEPEKIKFPLELPAIAIAEDQWMCVIDAKLLMKFRDAQLIEYNEQTQRTLTRVVRQGIETYKITINRKAIEGIKRSLIEGVYIPNTITLNMPEGTEFDYMFGKDGPAIVIDNIEHFDIIDGYHRYIAMSELYNEDPTFNYSMELRLVSFREEKARQFIWQEDQKTKMSKVESESFNQYKLSNSIVKRICSGPYNGIIKSKTGIIDSAVLSNVLDFTYLKTRKTLTRSEEINIAKTIEKDLNKLEEHDPQIFDKKWNREFTICVIFCLWRGINVKDTLTFAKKNKDLISARLNGKDIMRLNAALETDGYV